jgi:hypothetical protein
MRGNAMGESYYHQAHTSGRVTVLYSYLGSKSSYVLLSSAATATVCTGLTVTLRRLVLLGLW